MKKSYLFLIFCLSLVVAAIAPVQTTVLADGDEGDLSGEVDPDGGDPDGEGTSTTPSNPWMGWGNNGSSDGTGNANAGTKPNPTPDTTSSANATTGQNSNPNVTSTNKNGVTTSNNTVASQDNIKRSSATSVTTQTGENDMDNSANNQEIAEAVDGAVKESSIADSESAMDDAPAIIATIRHINPWIVTGIFILVIASVVGIAILAAFLLKKHAKKTSKN